MIKFLLKVLVVVFVGLFALLHFLGGPSESTGRYAGSSRAVASSAMRQDPKIVELKLVGRQGHAEMYALANPADPATPDKIAKQLQYICDATNFPVCLMMVWKNAADAPTALPMSDRQADAEYINYNRNLNTKHEQLLVGDGKGNMNEFPFARSIP